MFKKRSAIIHANKISITQLFQRATCGLLIISFLSVSTPAAPETIVGTTARAWQDIRFSFLSSQLAIDSPNWFTALFKGAQNTNRPVVISRIRIFPGGPLTLVRGQETVFSAVAYDIDGEPISGIAFDWTITDTGRSLLPIPFVNSVFRARRPGTFIVKARAGNREAQIPVVVLPMRNAQPSNLPVRTISSRTGIVAQQVRDDEVSKDQRETFDKNDEAQKTPVQDNLLPGEG